MLDIDMLDEMRIFYILSQVDTHFVVLILNNVFGFQINLNTKFLNPHHFFNSITESNIFCFSCQD